MGLLSFSPSPSKRSPTPVVSSSSPSPLRYRHVGSQALPPPRHRWSRPPSRSSGFHRRQAASQRPAPRCGPLRGDQRLRLVLPQQAEVPFVLEEVLERQAHPWSLPLPSPVQDLLEDRQGHGCSQDRPRAEALGRMKVFEGVPPPY